MTQSRLAHFTKSCLRIIGIVLVVVTNLSAADNEFLSSIPQGEWREIPNTALRDVFPPESGHPGWGSIGPRGVVAAWSGAAFDAKRNVLIITGGGHSDYGGNEVYEFNLGSARWARTTDPSKVAPGTKPGQFVVVDSEAPVASHTYDGLVHLPETNQMFKFGGSFYGNGSPYDRHAYSFDLATKRWKRGAEAPAYVLQVNSDYDPLTGQIIIGTGTGLMTYDPKADTWKSHPQLDPSTAAAAGVLDPEKRLYVQLMVARSQVSFYSLNKMSTRQKAAITGDTDWPSASGMAYHAPSKRMVIWGGGRNVWAFNTTDWRVRKYDNVTSDAPFPLRSNGGEKSAGIYGRWQYVPEHDLFIAYNHTGDNVWLYKLPSADHKEIQKKCNVDLCVGLGQKFRKPSEAALVAKDGQTIDIDAGEYVGDAAIWSQNNLTIRGVNGRAHINAKGISVLGKGTWLVRGADTTIENIEFSGAKVPDRNGAGIRLEAKNLVVRNCYFHHNENGILTGVNEDSDIVIEHSEFAHNGYGDGQSHNIYVGRVRSLTVKFSHLHHANVGHDLKSRAITNHILYNRIVDESDGKASYEIDLPDGGLAYIIGNVIQQSPKTENNTIVSYGEEGLKKSTHQIFIVNNTMINDGPREGVFIRIKFAVEIAKIVNNVFSGSGTLLDGVAELKNNLTIEKSDFVAPEHYDYRLRPGSKAIDAGVDAGEAHGESLLPMFQYVHPLQAAPRKINHRLDLGAFEQ
jgi:Right handed beta helix region